MKLKVGDKVRVLNEKGEGHITKIIDHLRVMVRHDGFDFPYPADQVVRIEQDHLMEKNLDKVIPKEHPVAPVTVNRPKLQKPPYREIDLHILELTDDNTRMTNAEMIRLQLSRFQYELEKAIKNKEKKIVFIHGVGQGVLRQEIRAILDEYDSVDYADASYQRYGFGATEVLIH